MKYQILVDSASDLSNNFLDKEKDIGFKVIPLTILANGKEFVDTDDVNIDEMLENMHQCKTNSSACPAPQSFLEEFDNADYTFIVTITAKLSGCYNAAVVAKNSYKNPENIHVIDSKATSGTEILIVEKLVNLIKAGKEFNEIVTAIEKYRDERSLFFSLQKFDNLVNTGRMSKIAGLVAKTLVIRPICIALEGEIKMERKVIGIKNAFKKMIQMIKEKAGELAPTQKLIISHCKATEEAEQIKGDIEKECNFKEIEIIPMKALCSYYALEKGIIICH